MRHKASFRWQAFRQTLLGAVFALICLSVSAKTVSAKTEKPHICYFEFDNTLTSQNFKRKIAQPDQEIKLCKTRQEFENAVIHCYQPQPGNNENGIQAFERMIQTIIKNKEKCDSLVISGHHTGNWSGSTGNLKLKDMESLSCKKEYKGWFDKIKALWLDGCNTVTDKFIESKGIVKTADSETARVVGKEYKSKIKKRHIQSYQQAYSASLDENTPLSSRYLRMFPHTQIYGFNGAAPAGQKQVGQQSFIYQHLTKLGQALSQEKNQNQAKSELAKWTRGLSALLSDDPCDEESIKVWEDTSKQARFKAVERQDYKNARRLGCDLILAKQVLDNPKSSAGQKALAQKIIQDHKKAQDILSDPLSSPGDKATAREIIKNKKSLELANSLLENASSKKAVELAKLSVISALKAVNEKDKNISETKLLYSHLLFNNIYDTWRTAQKYKTKDSDFFSRVKSEFQTKSFSQSLQKRIESPYTASLKKGDYIKFYTEIHDLNIRKLKAGHFIREEISRLLGKAQNIFSELRSPRTGRKKLLDIEARRALAVSAVDQLDQYNLLHETQIEDLLKNRKLFPNDTKNPFIVNVQTKLSFKNKTSREMLSAIQKGGVSDLRQNSRIHFGSKSFLERRDKQSLRQLADWIRTNRKGNKLDHSRQAVMDALFYHLKHKTNEQKAKILLDLSNSRGKADHLALWIVSYANSTNSSSAVRDKLRKKMTSEHKYKSILKDP